MDPERAVRIYRKRQKLLSSPIIYIAIGITTGARLEDPHKAFTIGVQGTDRQFAPSFNRITALTGLLFRDIIFPF